MAYVMMPYGAVISSLGWAAIASIVWGDGDDDLQVQATLQPLLGSMKGPLLGNLGAQWPSSQGLISPFNLGERDPEAATPP
jgi:hypothetical protein